MGPGHQEFADGIAPQQIAQNLNADRVPGPGGRPWLGTTIRADATWQTGILRNRTYVGEIVYGRMKFRKDPLTGKRVSKPSDNMMVEAAPSLRIIDQDLWEAVQARLAANAWTLERDEAGVALNRAHRKQYLLSAC